MKARLVNIILVEDGDNQTYFTLQGVQISEFKAGAVRRLADQKPNKLLKEIKKIKHGGVITALTPKQAAQTKELEEEKLFDKIKRYEMPPMSEE